MNETNSMTFNVTTRPDGYVESVVADEWRTCDGMLQLVRDGHVVAMFVDWRFFVIAEA